MRTSSTVVKERQFLNEGFKQIHQVVEERIFQFDVKNWLKGVLEDCMLTEFEERTICVDFYQRSERRKNLRNGFYTRSLLTVYGLIEDLKVPRPRQGGFSPSVFDKHERRERALNKVITECFWRGVSTRDMTHVVHKLTSEHVSASVVTRLTKKWTAEALDWHLRPLSDDYAYLMVDGVWIKNRGIGGQKKRLVLVAYGVKDTGVREIIDYQLSQSESEQNWLKFLSQLTHRGLEGKKLKLIVSDGCKGLENAVDMLFPMVDHQLCWAHKMRNVLDKAKKSQQEEMKNDLHKIFAKEVTKKEQAMKIIWTFSKKWRSVCPAAVRCLEKDLERLLFYFKCPVTHHKAVRTSNHIERQFKEFRRRLRSMEVLPNKMSAERAMYALTQIRNEKLRAYPMEFTQKNLH
jgi:putative transposase